MNSLWQWAKLILATVFMGQIMLTQSVAQQVPESPLIKLNVIVRDSQGHPVKNLKQEEFRVLEDGTPQTISFFQDEEQPIVYGLVIDNSGTFIKVLDPAIEAAKHIFQRNAPQDETMIIRFVSSDKLEVVKDFTSDTKDLINAITPLYVEKGETALIDAVYLSTQKVTQYKSDNDKVRRVLILMTDGDDRASFYGRDKLIKLLRQQNVQIFAIGLGTENLPKDSDLLLDKGPRKRATELLTKLANETGGLAFFPKSVSELQSVASEILQIIRTQYVIGYKPPYNGRSKSTHQVMVKIVNALGQNPFIVTARNGYEVVGK